MPLDSTPDDTLDVAAQPAAAEAVAAPVAAPEPVATPAEPTSALDAALQALAKGKEPAPATAAQPAEETVESTPEQPARPEDIQDESLADVPKLAPDVFSALPKEARTAFNALRKQVATFRPDAERGQAVANFLQASGITPQEFAELQDVGALMKRDPMKAREALLKHLDTLDTRLGLKLPDDIKSDVEQGYISEDRATELSQKRAEADALRQQVAERETAAAGRSMAAAVEAWEAEVRRQDADYGRKQANIMREVTTQIQLRQARGEPVRTPAEAVAIAQEAYAATNEMLKPFQAPRPSVPRGPSSAASSAPAATPEPTTALEAARLALAKRGRG
jgi:hypothetical protein